MKEHNGIDLWTCECSHCETWRGAWKLCAMVSVMRLHGHDDSEMLAFARSTASPEIRQLAIDMVDRLLEEVPDLKAAGEAATAGIDNASMRTSPEGLD